MRQIQDFSVQRMNNGAHFTFMSDVQARALADEVVMAKAEALVNALKTAVAAEDEALKLSQKNMLTDDIAKADSDRDSLYILPLAIMVLGPTAEMGIFLVVFGVMLPITAQTAAGVEAVDPVMRNTARSFGMSQGEILWRVVLPGSSPYIGTAMRVAAPVTLIMTVVAGMLALGLVAIGGVASLTRYHPSYEADQARMDS